MDRELSIPHLRILIIEVVQVVDLTFEVVAPTRFRGTAYQFRASANANFILSKPAEYDWLEITKCRTSTFGTFDFVSNPYLNFLKSEFPSMDFEFIPNPYDERPGKLKKVICMDDCDWAIFKHSFLRD